jgi:ER-bound oxygenase mpaB/B'/Rubber oxygenase, catalytic domain
MNQAAWKTDEYLNKMRRVKDPLADDAVAALFQGDLMQGFIKLFKEPLMQDGKPIAGLPDAVTHYLIEQAKPPTTWEVNPELLALGDDIQSSHGLLTLSILACASLPECYVDWRGMPVLKLTQQLSRKDAIERRVIETCLYLNYVLSNDGFDPRGPALALVATRKVRLMHAAARYLILAPDDEVNAKLPPDAAKRFNDFDDTFWTSEGQPINQEDLAYTLQTFSWVGVRGLRTLRLGLSDREEEAIIHCWRLAGHHMGILDELVPATVDESRKAFDQMKKRLAFFEEGNERGEMGRRDGVELTNALMDWATDGFLKGVMDSLDAKVGTHRHILTQKKLAPLTKQLMLHLVGEKTAGMLGIKRSDYDSSQWARARRWLFVVGSIARIREWGLDRIPGFRAFSNFAFEQISGMRWERIIKEKNWTPFARDVGDHWSADEAPTQGGSAEA